MDNVARNVLQRWICESVSSFFSFLLLALCCRKSCIARINRRLRMRISILKNIQMSENTSAQLNAFA